MARVNVPVTTSSRGDGVALPAATTGDATNNHRIVNDGEVLVIAKNTNAGSTARTVTFRVHQTVDGQTVTSTARSIAAGAERIYGPFPVSKYGSVLEVDVSHAEVTLRAIKSGS